MRDRFRQFLLGICTLLAVIPLCVVVAHFGALIGATFFALPRPVGQEWGAAFIMGCIPFGLLLVVWYVGFICEGWWKRRA